MKRKLSTKQILLISLTFTLFFSLILKAYSTSKLIAQGSNFQLYFPQNTTLSFQHLATGYTDAFQINVTVDSGILNGSNAQLRMWETSGEFKFDSLDTATISASSTAQIWLNNENIGQNASIQTGDSVAILWAISYSPIIPIMFGLGMLGLAGTFAGPLYAIHLIKQKKYYDGFISGLIITSFSLALLISWLWQ